MMTYLGLLYQDLIRRGDVLQRLLTRRFGPLPADCVARIQAASSGQLEQWSDQVLDARTLAEVFDPA